MIAAIAGILNYPQAGIINPAEIAPIASIYLTVWAAIGGRGRLYGAVIGAAFVSFASSWFTGAARPTSTSAFTRSNGLTGGWCCWCSPSCSSPSMPRAALQARSTALPTCYRRSGAGHRLAPMTAAFRNTRLTNDQPS